MPLRILIIIGLASAGLLLSILSSISPTTVGAFGILSVFFLSYITILCVLTLLSWLIISLIRAANREGKGLMRRISRIKLQEVYYFSTVIALAPIIIVSLKSVGGVSLYGLALVALFEILGCIYVAKRTA